MQTQEGDLIIYAVNLTDGQGQTLVQAEAGTCLAISSPTEITKNDGYYVIDQIDNVVSGPCNESVTDVGTGCLLYNDRILVLDNLYTNPVYTYGQAGKPEISLSVDVGHTPVFKGEDMFMGGGASYLRFTNGDYSYVAYSGIGKGWGYEGLLVYNGSELIAHQECKDNNNLFADIDFNKIPAETDTASFIYPP